MPSDIRTAVESQPSELATDNTDVASLTDGTSASSPVRSGHIDERSDTSVLAATNAPPRRKLRRRKKNSIPLKEWNSLPDYLQDNEYIKKYYRVDQTISQTLWSLFTVHNETGNVWTHLIGAVLFTVLTVVTIAAHPAPVRLATEHLSSLEDRFINTASDIWQAGRSWESTLRGAGGQTHKHCRELFDGKHVVDLGKEHSVFPVNSTCIASLIEHQLWTARQQLEQMLAAAGRDGATALQELEQRLRGCGESRLQDLLAWETWLLQHKTANMKALEAAISQGLASVVDLQWPSKRWPIHVFTFGAMFCLATSTMCHLFSSVGLQFAQTIWRFDYAGIVVLIVTSFVPVVYYTFLCNPATQYFYLISTVALGFVTITVSLMSTFQSAKYRTFRAGLFATLGLWGIVPGLHALLLYGASSHLQRAVGLDVLMGATYLGGAALYASRIPERWNPGAFDLFFNSHQIFHIAVVVAAVIHYCGVRILLEWRDSTGGCTVPFKDLMATAAQNGTKL